MSVAFRPAAEADLDLLLAFMEAFYAFDHLTFEPAPARAAAERLVRDPSLGGVWLIEEGGRPVGYVVLALGYSLEFHGRDAFVDELYLVETHRGRGIGPQALAFLEAVCRERGVAALHLEVERQNTAAQAVYRKAGFVDHDRYLLTKRLAPA